MRTPSRERRKARLGFAKQFLEEVILHGIEEGSLTDSRQVPELLNTFKSKSVGLGSDFDLETVWYVAWALSKHPKATDQMKSAETLLENSLPR